MPTAAEIEAAKTPAGGWTRETLAQWGVPWPPPKGWRRAVIEQSTTAKGAALNDPLPCLLQMSSSKSRGPRSLNRRQAVEGGCRLFVLSSRCRRQTVSRGQIVVTSRQSHAPLKTNCDDLSQALISIPGATRWPLPGVSQ